MPIIELSTFKLKGEAEEAAFTAALARTDRWLADQPGFIARRYGAGEAGWVDYVEYESMEAAQDIARRFLAAPEAQDFMAAIDVLSVSMRHFHLKS